MSTGVTCNNCGSTYITSYIFCPNCNSNLTLPNKLEMSDVSYKENIEDEYFEQYERINEKIASYDWTEYEKKQQEQMMKSLEVEEKRIELDIKRWTEKVEDEKSDVETLKSLTWTSFKAKITGSHDDALKREEEEYLEAMTQLEDAKKEKENIRAKLKNVKLDLEKIKTAEQKKEQLVRMQTDLVFQASEGIKDETEDKLELEINKLAQQIDPLTIRKSRIQTAFSFLQMASEFIRDAVIRIDEEGDRVEQQNALLIDTLTKSDVAELRQVVKEASTSLNQAYEIMQTQLEGQELIEGQSTGLFQGQNLWEKFMKNFMSDMKKGFRSRNETKEQLNRAVGDINKLQSWVNSLLKDINYKINELMNQLQVLEQDLIEERKRIFRQHYNEYETE